MNLQIYRPLKYLSPTSFQEFLLCQMKFYLKRLSQYDWPVDQQGIPAAIGSAFDALVKVHIAKHIGVQDDPRYALDTLMKNCSHKDYIPVARSLFDEYIVSGWMDRLLKEGVAEIEMERQTNIDGVEILGKPDLLLKSGSFLDFKVNGANSKSGASPTAGYNICWMNGKIKNHDRAGEPLENLNESWAIQACFYNWLYTGYSHRDLPYAIEQVAVRGNTIGIASFRTHISADYQTKLWQAVKQVWENINNGEFQEADPHPSRCMSYGQLCVVADKCEKYQKQQKLVDINPELASLKR